MDKSIWNKEGVAVAIQTALEKGDDSSLIRAFREAPVQTITTALAEAAAIFEGSQSLLLKTLIEKAFEMRPALLTRARKDFEKINRLQLPERGVEALITILEGASRRTSAAKNADREIVGRLKSSFNDFGVSALVRLDMLNTPFDADALGDIEIAEIPKMNEGSLKDLEAKLFSRAKSVRNPAIKARLYLQAAKLLMSQSNARDYQTQIYFYVSSYCSRQGEVFAEQQVRLDTAQDYLLECIAHQRAMRDFPTELYLRTVLRAYSSEFPEAKKISIWEKPRKPSELSLRPYLVRDLEAAKHIGLALLKLSQRDIDWAWLNAGWESREIAVFFSDALKSVFPAVEFFHKENPRDIFLELSKNYGEVWGALENQLKASLTSPRTLASIASFAEPFEKVFKNAEPILRRREKTALKYLQMSAIRCKQSRDSSGAANSRELLSQAKRELESAFETSSGLAIGAIHIAPIYESWIPLIDSSIDEISVLVRPNVDVRLAKKTYLHRGRKAEVALEVFNNGPGMAFNIDLEARWNDKDLEVWIARRNLAARSVCLATTSSDIALTPAELQISWTAKCADVDGRTYSFTNKHPLIIKGAPPDIDFDDLKLKNPFNAGAVVTDPKMFFGRERLLKRLEEVVLSAKNKGELRILYGQRRVGKSSILHFLTQRLHELDSIPIIVASVTWLTFSTHNPENVVYEIARKLAKEARRIGIGTPAMVEKKYRENYSFQFNKLLNAIMSERNDIRIAILIDEFDKAFYQFSDPKLDYGEPFYSYLRGLSMLPGVTLILAGGETLPEFLRQLGPTFNNAKRERATYLDHSATEELIRNEYVRWLDFDNAGVDRIFEYTQGNPFFSQMLCHEIVDTACDLHSLEISYADVDSAASELVTMKLGPESLGHLYMVGDKIDPIESAMLYCLSRNLKEAVEEPWIPSKDLENRISSEHATFQRALNHLVEREVIKYCSDAPEMIGIVMPLFSAWYKQTCPLPKPSWELINREDKSNGE